MKKHTRILSFLLALTLLGVGFSLPASAITTEQREKIEAFTHLGLYQQYAGQWGFGGQKIYDPIAYLEDRYKGTAELVDSKILNTESFLMNDIHPELYADDAKYAWGDCQNIAIARSLLYLAKNGYDKIPTDIFAIYDVVDAAVAQVNKRFGYSLVGLDKLLKIPTISPLHGALVRQILKNFGYTNTTAYNEVIPKFSKLQSEINANRPPVINYLWGFYNLHVVTANGYQTYKVTDAKGKVTTVNFALTFDGHTRTQTYLDYNVFSTFYQGFLIIINPGN
jgi:hypothetical protein